MDNTKYMHVNKLQALLQLTQFLGAVLESGEMIKIVIIAAAGNSPQDVQLGLSTINMDMQDMDFLQDWARNELKRRLHMRNYGGPTEEESNVFNIFDGSPRK